MVGWQIRGGVVPKSMNPLWGLKLRLDRAIAIKKPSSQKHESSLGIETNAPGSSVIRPAGSQKHESSLGIETH